MKFRISLLCVALALSASAALAVDFGVHGGYYGNDLKEAFVGADLSLPLGPVAFVPNLDYSQTQDIDYWIGSADFDLQYKTSGGPSYWFGAGPSYRYFTGYARRNRVENVKMGIGFDANAGFGWTVGGIKPYVTGRYVRFNDFKALGGAIGLRF
jgi:opacity protein-like surface antigen